MSQPDTNDHLSRISTRWDLLREAQQGGDPAAEAQRLLMKRYCGAVYHYLVAALRDPVAAEDVSQEFALRFLRGDFKAADPQRGRFRNYVKTVLYHLVADYHRARNVQPDSLPSEASRLPIAAPGPADQVFVTCWREELLDRTWDELAALETQTGQPYCTVLRWRAENPTEPAARLAEQLTQERGKAFTEAGIRQTLHRAREKFVTFLLDEVGRSIQSTDPADVEQELAELGLLAYSRQAPQRRGREK
jgi:RNA polymerase sigma-70 factor (ECF subfamily)